MSIFHDKKLKSVAEAAAKIMGEQLKGNQHKIDANKNGKVDAHDFKLLRAKKDMKKEEVELDEAKTQSKDEKDKVVAAVTKAMRQSRANVMQGKNERSAARMNAKIKNNMKEDVEQLDEVGDTPAGRKALSSYVQKALHDKDRQKGLRKATSRLYKDNYYGKKTNEEVEQLDELVGKGKLPQIASYHKEKGAEAKGKMEKIRNTNTTVPVPKEKSAKIYAKDAEAKYHSTQEKRAKALMKKEEVEQVEEGFGDLVKGVKRVMAGKKNPSDVRDAHLAKSTFSSNPKVKEKESRRYDKVDSLLMKKEEVELNEGFPTVADAKKRMDAGKTSTGSVTKTKTGLVHKRDYKDEDESDDMQKKAKGYGARQNYKRSTRVNEQLSFTEMLELYNEHGLKVLAPIETEEMDIDGTTIQVIDGDKINGYVETTIGEEVTNDEFTKEFKDQQASFEGKKKQPKVAAGKTTGVKEMPESFQQIDERELTAGESKKKEEIVKSMKKGLSGFKQRYGERAKEVMYATATKQAKKD
jgi:hypothetical protein